MQRKNHGIISKLNEINKTIRDYLNASKASLWIISIMALMTSLLSIYFQIFYEKYDLYANLIDSEILKDTLNLNIVYHNKGNLDATILESEIYFYTDSLNDPKEGIQFKGKNYIPFVISAGQQKYHNFKQVMNFKNINFSSFIINPRDTIRIFLNFRFINYNGYQAEKSISCGWITLNDKFDVNFWEINYNKVLLENDTYIIGIHRN